MAAEAARAKKHKRVVGGAGSGGEIVDRLMAEIAAEFEEIAAPGVIAPVTSPPLASKVSALPSVTSPWIAPALVSASALPSVTSP